MFQLHAGFPCPTNPSGTSDTLMKVRSGVEVSGQSDIGCQRENNEDSFGYWEPEGDEEFLRKGRLAIVADGMGGYEGGQEASNLAVETVSSFYRDHNGGDPQQTLNDALQAAHDRVREHGFAHPKLRGMGTTCTAIALVGNALHYVHVGDTRLYLVRDGHITQITRDHSYVARLLEAGMISREEAEKHPQRNILTAALGTSADLIMESPGQPAVVQSGDVLVVCSDGLWGQVQDAEIQEAVANQSPEAAARALIELARERGGPDNITLQILRLN
jgi:serine/threonine protein phosphatase PrpC